MVVKNCPRWENGVMSNPNPLFPLLGAAGRPKKPNDLALTVGMVAKLRPEIDEQPLSYMNRIFEACFTKDELQKQYPEIAARAEVAKELLPEQFELRPTNNERDQRLADALSAADATNSLAVAMALRDLVRGYTDADVSLETVDVEKDMANRKAKIKRFRAENERRRRKAKNRGEKALAYQYKQNRLALARMADDLKPATRILLLGDAQSKQDLKQRLMQFQRNKKPTA